MKTHRNLTSGFTLVEIMIVVAIIGLLAAIAIPNLVRARQTSQSNSCINNLRVIDASKTQWALEQGKGTGAVPLSSDLQPYIGRGSSSFPVCPLSPSGSPAYSINAMGLTPGCANYTTNTHPAILN